MKGYFSYLDFHLKNIRTLNQASSLYMWQGWTRKKFIKLGHIEGLVLEIQIGAQVGPVPCISYVARGPGLEARVASNHVVAGFYIYT